MFDLPMGPPFVWSTNYCSKPGYQLCSFRIRFPSHRSIRSVAYIISIKWWWMKKHRSTIPIYPVGVIRTDQEINAGQQGCQEKENFTEFTCRNPSGLRPTRVCGVAVCRNREFSWWVNICSSMAAVKTNHSKRQFCRQFFYCFPFDTRLLCID